jgi:O-antigen/teichoic acid export membrane protein
VLKSVGHFALARGLPGLVNFAALAIFTRLLNAQEYGYYALVVATAMLVYACCFQWLGLAMLRLLPTEGPGRRAFLATILRLYWIIAAGAGGILLLLALRRGGELALSLRISGVALLIALAWHEINLFLVTADHRPSRYALLAGLRSVIGLVCGMVAAAAGWGAAGVIAGLAAGFAAAGAVGFALQWRGALHGGVDPAVRRSVLVYGLPLAVAYVLDYVVSTSDRLMLGVMVSAAASGLYSPAYDLCQQALWALMIIINLAAYPMAIRAVEQTDQATRERQFRQHFLLISAIAVPAAAGLGFLAPSVSGLLGPQFAPAARGLLPIIAAAMLIGGMKSFYFDLSFQLGHATWLQLATVGLAAIVNLGLNLLLIPRLGITGAAWATLAAYAVALAVSGVLGRRVLPLPVPWAGLGRIGLAVVGMLVAVMPLRGLTGGAALAGQVVVGISVYGVLLFALNPGQMRMAMVSVISKR